jgi:hypothetical protein
MAPRELRAGDLVELRPPAEILATLDESGATDGLPFMPEMLEYFDKSWRVQARVERNCAYPFTWGVRRLPATVMLDDLRCGGQAHGGCQAGCRLYWKESWLRPASGRATPVARDDAYSELERLVGQNTETAASTADEPVFRCQGTDWFEASEPVGWWSARSFVREWRCGNVSFWQFSKKMTGVVFGEIGARLHLVERYRTMPHDPSSHPVETPPPRGLEPGTLVQIRSREEIAPTLDARAKNKGLAFDPNEMAPYCGKTFPVKGSVQRFVDEKTGKLVQLKSDCYVLDGVVCSGDRSDGRWFCQRAIYSWWREAWLQRVAEQSPMPSPEDEQDRSLQTQL